MRALSTLTAILLLTLAACSPGATEDSSGTAGAGGSDLQVERTTTGDVTTVRNIAGSQWGGVATLELVREIGVEEGDDEYMFIRPNAIWATEDEIFVFDHGVPIVRVYGFDGMHRRSFGRGGEGPGEFGTPAFLTVVGDRVVIEDLNGSALRWMFFSLDGDLIEQWNLGSMIDTTFPFPGLTETSGGLVTPIRQRSERSGGRVGSWESRSGVQKATAAGREGEPWFAPEFEGIVPTFEVTMGSATMAQPTPFSVSSPTIAVLPGGDIVWGYGDAYRFTIEHPDGSRTVVERVAPAVPVHPGEADEARLQIVALNRRRIPDFNWDGAGIPETKPWYSRFLVDRSGRLWVSRGGEAVHVEGCTTPEVMQQDIRIEPCWRAKALLEAFDFDGNYLGSLDRGDDEPFYAPFFAGDRLIAGHLDEAGTYRIRIYRLVLPGGGGGSSSVQ